MPDELNTIEVHGTVEKGKCTVLRMDRKPACLINVPSSHHPFFAVRSDFFKSLVCSHLRAVHDCHDAEISKNFKEIIPIGPDVRLT